MVRELIALAADKHPRVRQAALEAIGEGAGADAATIRADAERLIDVDMDVRETAKRVLRRLACRGGISLAVLDRMLASASRPQKYAIVEILDTLAESNPKVVTTIRRLTEDEDWRIRAAAFELIARRGACSLRGLASLFCGALRDEHSNVRQTAARAIATLHLADEIHTAMEPLLDDPDAEIRRLAVSALGEIALCSPGMELLLTLAGCYADEDWQVREAALDTFRKLGRSAESLSALVTALDHRNRFLRDAAARLAGRLEWTDEAMKGRLKALLISDADPRTRQASFASLCKLTGDGERVPLVIQALKDHDALVRGEALSWLRLNPVKDRKLRRLIRRIAKEDHREELKIKAAELLAVKNRRSSSHRNSQHS